MTELPRDADTAMTRLPDQSGTASGDERGDSGLVRVTAWVRGRVQGVGFRWWTRAQALELDLLGWARNLPDGRVEVLAQGPQARVRELIRRLEAPPEEVDRRPGRVDGVTQRWSDPRDGLQGFVER